MSDNPGFDGLHDDDDEGQVTAPYWGTPTPGTPTTRTPTTRTPITGAPTKVLTYAMSSMRTSPEGLAFITSVEGRGSDTDRLQSPGGGSGVTVGLGYDLHGQNPSVIVSDLTGVGIDRKKAEFLLSAHDLVGGAAAKFVQDNRNLIALTTSQKQALLKKIVGRYEKKVKDAANFPVTQFQFDALVALAYDPGGGINVITRSIASGNFAQAEKDWLSRTHSRLNSHSKAVSMGGLVIRRNREVNLYKTGIYN